MKLVPPKMLASSPRSGRGGWLAYRARHAPAHGARLRARSVLVDRLGDTYGLLRKAAQITATSDEDEELRELAEAAPALPLEALLPTLASAFHRSPRELFTDLDHSGIAGGLGQVHRGSLADGREVAVKIRLPAIDRAVRGEATLAAALPGMGPFGAWGFDLESYRRLVTRLLEEELDYPAEARRQREFAAQTPIEGLVVPRVVEGLEHAEVIVQEWQAGVPVEEAGSWGRADRLLLAETALRTLAHGLFVSGLVHADPHPSNLRVRQSEAGPELVLYDYGCMLRLSAERRGSLLALIMALREDRPHELGAILTALGFDSGRLGALGDEVATALRIMFEPWCSDQPFATESWNALVRSREQLRDRRWGVRAAAPPEFLLLLRAIHGWAAWISRLGIALPWWPLTARLVGTDRLAQARVLRRSEAAGPPSGPPQPILRIRLDRAGEVAFAVDLPGREALELRRIVPLGAAERLAEGGVDLAAIERTLAATALAPRLLVDWRDGDRRVRIALE